MAILSTYIDRPSHGLTITIPLPVILCLRMETGSEDDEEEDDEMVVVNCSHGQASDCEGCKAQVRLVTLLILCDL